MSEKIYAFLLRLYPHAFRKRYEEETIQLLRDRWRDEPGYLRRLRLGFDLIFDIARSLPHAYRNSYEATSLAPISHTVDSGQMFQSLHSEPIRRGAFVIAGALTATVLVTFGYVMELPMPSPTFRSNGNKSAIESVLERLNKQASPGPTESVRSEASHSTQTAGSDLEQRQTLPRNAAPPRASSAPAPHAPGAASYQAGQTLEAAKAVPNASAFEADFSSDARKPRSAMGAGQRIQETESGATSGRSTTRMSSRPQMFVDLPAGLSGRWIEYPAISADAEFPGGLILVQRSKVLSGFGALGSGNQNPMIHGSVAGESVRFELSDGRKSFQYDLKVDGEELRGTLTIKNGNETRTATVRLRRAR